VLTLQSELDEIEKKLLSTRNLMNELHGGSAISEGFMDDLEARQRQVVEKVEELYASLNVHETLPELKGIDAEFITTLFLARHLKMNIRMRAISSFFEWDKLNQAKGGREVAIGAYLATISHNSIPDMPLKEPNFTSTQETPCLSEPQHCVGRSSASTSFVKS
jgi:hypothetical protein